MALPPDPLPERKPPKPTAASATELLILRGKVETAARQLERAEQEFTHGLTANMDYVHIQIVAALAVLRGR